MREKSTQLGKEASATFNDIHSFCMQTMKNGNEKKMEMKYTMRNQIFKFYAP